MNLNIVPLFGPRRRPRGWSNQEFAEFYRVENSLIRAGLSIDTDHGLSDEGDPWFVFCHSETGDIVIHFARLDGIYVVASAALDRCMRGANFRSLIEALIDSHPIAIAKGDGAAKITIHPAALIVAVVISCYFKLGQTQAFASPVSTGTSHAAVPADGEDHDAAMSVMAHDSRSDMLLAAIAFAGISENLAEADGAPVFGPGAPDLIQPTTFTSTPEHPAGWFLSVDESGLAFEHSGQAADHFQPIVEAGSVGDLAAPPRDESRATLQSPAIVPFENYHFGNLPVLSLEESGFANGVGQNASKGAGELVWLPALVNVTLEPKGVTGLASPPAITSNPESVQVINDVLGSAVSTHLVLDSTGVQPQLVVSLVEHNGVAVAQRDTTSPGAASQAKGAVADSTGSSAHSTSGWAAAAHISEISLSSSEHSILAFDNAFISFISAHPDYKILESHNEAVVFDAHLNSANINQANVAIYHFPDGSEVTLVGVATHATPHM